MEPPLGLVGGGARDIGLVKALSEATGMEIQVPPDPHMTAALGAALLAAEKCASKSLVAISKDRGVAVFSVSQYPFGRESVVL